MGKFGFGKKGEGEEDSNRLALFGSRSKSKSPAPSSNPYAQPPSSDPYSKQPPPYNSPPPAYGSGAGGPGSQRNDMQKTSYDTPDSKYGGGFTAGKQGDQGGYGGDRFGGGSRGGGGYGGLGRTDPNDPNAVDQNRDALFGDARSRVQERVQERANTSSAPPSYNNQTPDDRHMPGGTAGGAPSWGPYQERNLTAEEEEEEDVQAMKQEIRFMKQKDVASTRNALRAAAQAEETGRDALARLGAQGERIHNTEKNLDLAANQNVIAEEKARELKRLNKSMFAMKVSNPFTSEQRRQARDDAIIDRHHEERMQREETRLAAFRTNQRMDQTFKDLNKQQSNGPEKKTNLAERSKYQFEQDSEDDEMENEIESNLTALQGAAGRLNALAKATGKEIDSQDPTLQSTLAKSNRVDDQIHMNRERLNRIR